MENLEIDPVTAAIAEALFREQNEEVLWAGRCCNRITVSATQRPVKCGACGKPAEGVIELRPEHLSR